MDTKNVNLKLSEIAYLWGIVKTYEKCNILDQDNKKCVKSILKELDKFIDPEVQTMMENLWPN